MNITRWIKFGGGWREGNNIIAGIFCLVIMICHYICSGITSS